MTPLEHHLTQYTNNHGQTFCTLYKTLHGIECNFVHNSDIQTVSPVFSAYGYLDMALMQMLYMPHLDTEHENIEFLRALLTYNEMNFKYLVMDFLNEVALAEIEKETATEN